MSWRSDIPQRPRIRTIPGPSIRRIIHSLGTDIVLDSVVLKDLFEWEGKTMANYLYRASIPFVISAAAFLLTGCYTQMAVKEERTHDYGSERESYSNETYIDSTGRESERYYADDYGEARQQLYFDYYYPGFAVGWGFGFGYHPLWSPGYRGYYNPYWYGYSPWYGGVMLPEYPWGWYYPHRTGYYHNSGYAGGYGATRAFGTTRTIGGTRNVLGNAGRSSYTNTPSAGTGYGSARGYRARVAPANAPATRFSKGKRDDGSGGVRSTPAPRVNSAPAVRERRNREARAAEHSARGGARNESGRSAPGRSYSPPPARSSPPPGSAPSGRSGGESRGSGESRGGGRHR